MDFGFFTGQKSKNNNNNNNNDSKHHYYIGSPINDNILCEKLKNVRKKLVNKYNIKGDLHYQNIFTTNLIYLGYFDYYTAKHYMNKIIKYLCNSIVKKYGKLECKIKNFKLHYDQTFYKIMVQLEDDNDFLKNSIIPYLYHKGIETIHGNRKYEKKASIDMIYFKESQKIKEQKKKFGKKFKIVGIDLPIDKFIIDKLVLIQGTPLITRSGTPSTHDEMDFKLINDFEYIFNGNTFIKNNNPQNNNHSNNNPQTNNHSNNNPQTNNQQTNNNSNNNPQTNNHSNSNNNPLINNHSNNNNLQTNNHSNNNNYSNNNNQININQSINNLLNNNGSNSNLSNNLRNLQGGFNNNKTQYFNSEEDKAIFLWKSLISGLYGYNDINLIKNENDDNKYIFKKEDNILTKNPYMDNEIKKILNILNSNCPNNNINSNKIKFVNLKEFDLKESSLNIEKQYSFENKPFLYNFIKKHSNINNNQCLVNNKNKSSNNEKNLTNDILLLYKKIYHPTNGKSESGPIYNFINKYKNNKIISRTDITLIVNHLSGIQVGNKNDLKEKAIKLQKHFLEINKVQ